MSFLTKVDQSPDLFPTQIVLKDTAPSAGNTGGLTFNLGIPTTKIAAGIAIDFAPINIQASPTATEFIIERKVKTSINRWRPYISRFTDNTIPNHTTISSGGTSGQNQCVLVLATGIAVGQWLFFQNATIGNSEWGKVCALSSSTVTLQDPFEFTQTGSDVWNKAEVRVADIPLSVIRDGIRISFNNNRAGVVTGTNRDVVFRVTWVSLDSIDN